MAGAQSKKHKNALVTGGAGFIGSHCVDALVARGYHVTVVDNFQAGKLKNLSQARNKIKFIKGDIRDKSFTGRITKNQDTIIHIAANASVPYSVENPEYDFTTNVIGTYHLLRSALNHRVKRFVFASSAGVYGEPHYLPIDENHPTNPISPYGASKLAAEKIGIAYAKCFGLPFVSARIFNTFGPRLPRYVIFDFLKKLQTNTATLQILGNGKQVREFAYVKDTVQALLLLAEKDIEDGEIFNIAGSHVLSMTQLAKHMLKELGFKKTMLQFTGKSWAGDVKKTTGNISKIKALGFSPKYSFKEGLGETLRWFEEEFGKITNKKT